jgi:hypothetical protein
MKKMLDILAAIPSFQGLSENQLSEIKKIVVNRHFTEYFKSAAGKPAGYDAGNIVTNPVPDGRQRTDRSQETRYQDTGLLRA